MSPHPVETRRRVAELIGSGATYEEAGRTAGVPKRTVTRWMRDPDVRGIARDAREERLDPTAVGVLKELLKSRNETVRLRAATALLRDVKIHDPAAVPADDPTAAGPTILQVWFREDGTVEDEPPNGDEEPGTDEDLPLSSDAAAIQHGLGRL